MTYLCKQQGCRRKRKVSSGRQGIHGWKHESARIPSSLDREEQSANVLLARNGCKKGLRVQVDVLS